MRERSERRRRRGSERQEGGRGRKGDAGSGLVQDGPGPATRPSASAKLHNTQSRDGQHRLSLRTDYWMGHLFLPATSLIHLLFSLRDSSQHSARQSTDRSRRHLSLMRIALYRVIKHGRGPGTSCLSLAGRPLFLAPPVQSAGANHGRSAQPAFRGESLRVNYIKERQTR